MNIDTHILVTRRHWTLADIEKVSLDRRTWGVLLGDPFCQKRMFPYAEHDIAEYARAAHEANLHVAYQTPVYVTSRNWYSTLILLDKLQSLAALNLVFLHDLGLLAVLNSRGLDLVWDRFGHGRAHRPGSAAFVEFLLAEGVCGLEVMQPELLAPLANLGARPIYRSSELPLATFGRRCYTEKTLEAECNRLPLCRAEAIRLETRNHKSEDKKVAYLVDGYQVWEDAPASPSYFHLPAEAKTATWTVIMKYDELPTLT